MFRLPYLTREERDFFLDTVRPLLDDGDVRRMAAFPQHGGTSCLEHCLAVAYFSFAFVRRAGIRCDEAGLIRGALLHDFFLYDWHVRSLRSRRHAITHARAAWDNACEHFSLGAAEREVILRHMWPVTLCPPRRIEALVVNVTDKLCSLWETLAPAQGSAYDRFRLLAGL